MSAPAPSQLPPPPSIRPLPPPPLPPPNSDYGNSYSQPFIDDARRPPPPPPPPPPKEKEEEEDQKIQDALRQATRILEQSRCLQSEREATIAMATSLLSNPPASAEERVDVTGLPGGVQDAWFVLSEAASQKGTDTTADPLISGKFGPKLSAVQLAARAEERDVSVPTGHGQLGKATHMATLHGCLQRSAAIEKELSHRQPKDGATLKSAVVTAKSAPDQASEWLRAFDKRLREIRLYHARHGDRLSKRPRLSIGGGNPTADGYDLASLVTEHLTPVLDGTQYRAEEVMGKYLDLQSIYESHVTPIKDMFLPGNGEDNDKKNKASIGLNEFLLVLSRGLEKIPEDDKLKERKKYAKLLIALQDYLEGFLRRTSPLLDIDQVVKPAIKFFEDEWRSTGGCPGWKAKPSESNMVGGDDKSATKGDEEKLGIDLSPYATAEDLENAVDGDALKAELSRLGLKCGGTVADRAKRLFMTKDTPLDQLPKKVFAKRSGTIAANAKPDSDSSNHPGAGSLQSERRVDVARRETMVMALIHQLRPVVNATLRRMERRETQTVNEREREVDEDLHGTSVEADKKKSNGEEGDDDDSDADDDDAPIYNPKGVPLGWDGKPIPYWLFKLHGLNHFYPCEICGNESYRGRRNFELHFAEAKHAFGMRSLGIPNTKHFHGVTKIEDAQNLWRKLQHQLNESEFNGTQEEEYEDSHGNVLSRATYEDLARQGLL